MRTLIFTPEDVAGLKAKYPRFSEPWSEEETTTLVGLFMKATPFRTIAEKLGRSENAIRLRLTQEGLIYPNLSHTSEEWNAEDTERLRKYYSAGWKVTQCARWLGRTREEIRDRMKETGLTETAGEHHIRWKTDLIHKVIELSRSGMTEEDIALRLI